MSRWTNAAHLAMTNALLSSQMRKLDPAETARTIDAAYPFGDRSNSPYRAWLKVRREFFAAHGLPRKGDYQTQTQRSTDLVAQMLA